MTTWNKQEKDDIYQNFDNLLLDNTTDRLMLETGGELLSLNSSYVNELLTIWTNQSK